MRHTLLCHPSLPCPIPLELSFDASGTDTGLRLHYRLAGPMALLRIPPGAAESGFRDGLWQHCCFELFASPAGSTSYREFNFSPSGDWAAYAFSGYRKRSDWAPPAAPQIRVERCSEWLDVVIELPQVLLPEASPLQLGVSTVIESRTGEISYWALHHAGARPDFHLRESFVLDFALTPHTP